MDFGNCEALIGKINEMRHSQEELAFLVSGTTIGKNEAQRASEIERALDRGIFEVMEMIERIEAVYFIKEIANRYENDKEAKLSKANYATALIFHSLVLPKSVAVVKMNEALPMISTDEIDDSTFLSMMLRINEMPEMSVEFERMMTEKNKDADEPDLYAAYFAWLKGDEKNFDEILERLRRKPGLSENVFMMAVMAGRTKQAEELAVQVENGRNDFFAGSILNEYVEKFPDSARKIANTFFANKNYNYAARIYAKLGDVEMGYKILSVLPGERSKAQLMNLFGEFDLATQYIESKLADTTWRSSIDKLVPLAIEMAKRSEYDIPRKVLRTYGDFHISFPHLENVPLFLLLGDSESLLYRIEILFENKQYHTISGLLEKLYIPLLNYEVGKKVGNFAEK